MMTLKSEPNYREINIWTLVFGLDFPWVLAEAVNDYSVAKTFLTKYYGIYPFFGNEFVNYLEGRKPGRNDLIFGLAPWRVLPNESDYRMLFCKLPNKGWSLVFMYNFKEVTDFDHLAEQEETLADFWERKIFWCVDFYKQYTSLLCAHIEMGIKQTLVYFQKEVFPRR